MYFYDYKNYIVNSFSGYRKIRFLIFFFFLIFFTNKIQTYLINNKIETDQIWSGFLHFYSIFKNVAQNSETKLGKFKIIKKTNNEFA